MTLHYKWLFMSTQLVEPRFRIRCAISSLSVPFSHLPCHTDLTRTKTDYAFRKLPRLINGDANTLRYSEPNAWAKWKIFFAYDTKTLCFRDCLFWRSSPMKKRLHLCLFQTATNEEENHSAKKKSPSPEEKPEEMSISAPRREVITLSGKRYQINTTYSTKVGNLINVLMRHLLLDIINTYHINKWWQEKPWEIELQMQFGAAVIYYNLLPPPRIREKGVDWDLPKHDRCSSRISCRVRCRFEIAFKHYHFQMKIKDGRWPSSRHSSIDY